MAKSKQIDNIIEQLDAKNEELRGSSALGATTLLTFPMYNDSARMIMFSSHINQRVVLNETEFPKVFTNFENMVGEYNSYNQKSDADYEVIDIIEKFPDIPTGKDIQNVLFVVKDKATGRYDIIERHDVENLTEKYGFQYDNSALNKYGIGDTIPKGSPLTRPTSYDEYNNYGFGRNVKFMYTIDQDTIEDAIVISESLAKETGLLASTEVEEVKVPLNDNDILGNIYGDNDNYQTFPNIGEPVKNKILCVKKRIIKSQVLFDLKLSNTKKILSGDVPFYIDGIVTDIDIFCNKPFEELDTGVFNDQLRSYIQMTNRFYERVQEVTNNLIDSGAECSDNVLYWNKRVTELLDPDIKNKDDLGNAFGNIIMYFTVKRTIGVSVGQKITGKPLIAGAMWQHIA